MEVVVSSSLRDPTSEEITAVKIKRENRNSRKKKNAAACEINRSDDDKRSGENCIAEENNLNPNEIENSEQVNHNSKKKNHDSVPENNNSDDVHKSGENCMTNETNANSIKDKCLGEPQPKKKKVRPGKRAREALYLKGKCKSSCGDGTKVLEVSAAENGTNLPGGSVINNDPNLPEHTLADSATELPGAKRKRRNKGKWHSCSDTDNMDVNNTLSTSETECRSNTKKCSSKKRNSTEGLPVTKNSTDLENVSDLTRGSTSDSGIDLQGQKRKRKNVSEKQDGSESNVSDAGNITSTLDTKCKESCKNCTSEETIVTEGSAVIESDANLQGEKKKKKKKKRSKEDAVNQEAICEEGYPKAQQTSLSSSPIRGVTDPVPVSCSVTTEDDGLDLSCTSDALVLKEPVPPGKKKLLVLDINGLLADINTDYRYTEYADFKLSGKLVFKRPFCADFLNFCFTYFEIGVWSSRKKYNVEKAVQYLMGDLKRKLLFCWDQSKCTATNFNTIDNSHKPLVFKELRKLWEKEEPDLPWEKGRFTPSNTLLVDDSPYKALCNPPFTAIFPPPYSFKHKKDNSLGRGGDLRVYLEKMVTAEHVQYYVKENPFGQSAITDSHPQWKFYLRIINDLDKPLHSA